MYDIVLQAPSSCDSITRPTAPSDQRIGSSETRANGERLSAHTAAAGETPSSKMARSVWLPDSMNTAPVFQLTPMEGSPAPCAPLAVDPSGTGMFSSAG